MTTLLATFFASTAIFIQSQLKYGAQRDDFLHRWYERPLHQNTAYADQSDGSFLNLPAFKKTVETMRYGKIDGINFFASRLDQRWELFKKSLLPGCEITVLPTLSGQRNMDGYIKVVERVMSAPNAYRINGKCVFPVRGITSHYADDSFITNLKRILVEKFGDRILLLPCNCVFTKEEYNNGNPTPETVTAAKERLRNLLRAGDGFMYMMQLKGLVNRRYDKALFERVVAKIISDVYAEEEFKGKKLLGMHFNGGHLNSYRWQFNTDSNGTATLCDRYETAVKMSADIIIHGEWDEENENSQFRPMTSRGYAYMRIVRHFADRLAGREPTPAPGDDVTIPNLMLSYRKTLVAGETIEVEVRNIPDGTFKGQNFRVSFAWKDDSGRTVLSYPAKTLEASVQSAVRFTTPVAEVVSHRVLNPCFRVEWDGGFREYSEGLHQLGLRVVRNIDHMWVVQPLRELSEGTKGELEIGECDSNGVYTVRGKVTSPKKLRTVEVLDDMDSAYVHSDAPDVPAGYEQIRVRMTGFGKKPEMLTGSIRFRNSPGTILKPSLNKRVPVKVKDGAWFLKNSRCNNFGLDLWANVPSAEMTNGEIDIDIPPYFSGKVRLADLLTRDVVGFNSINHCGLSVMRFLPVAYLPRPLSGNQAEFTFRWKPLEKTSVLRLYVIDDDYRIWRGAAKTIYRPVGRTVPVSVFDRDRDKTVSIELDENRFDDITCDISGRADSVLHLSGGRMLTGMVGSSAELAQGFGRAESYNGYPLQERYKKSKNEAMPTNGWGTLSLQTIPGFAGFELTMKVKPKGFGVKQGLFGTGNCGLDVTLEPDGTVMALFAGGNAFTRKKTWLSVPVKGPTLKDGEWNTVKIATDRRTAWIEVNGVRGSAVPYSDYFFNQRYALFGCTIDAPNFFKGEIDSLSVKVK